MSKEIRERMRQAVRMNGIGLKRFCEENGISYSNFYITGMPSSYIVMLIAEKCGVTTDWILFGDKEK